MREIYDMIRDILYSLSPSKCKNLEIFSKTVSHAFSLSFNFDTRDLSGKTLVHHAVYLLNLEAVNILISFGSNVNLKDKKGRTCLDYAVELCNSTKNKKRRKILEKIIYNLEDVGGVNSEKFDVTCPNIKIYRKHSFIDIYTVDKSFINMLWK